MPEVIISYPAVLGATVAAMVIGFLWYGPLFGKKWLALSGIAPSAIETAKAQGMWKNYLINFIGAFVMAYVLAHSLVFASAYLEVTGLGAGLQGGFWNWLGFIAPVTLGSVLWEGKSWSLWVLTNGYYLVTLLVMGVILAVFA